jgi:hypothetical protein
MPSLVSTRHHGNIEGVLSGAIWIGESDKMSGVEIEKDR